MARLLVFCSLVAVVVLADGCTPSRAAAPARDGTATVVADTDGDTIDVDLGGQRQAVRFLGIDTPETHHPTKPVECYGQEASDRTAELLPPGTQVRLVRDVEARDRYGRLLAYVYRARDDLFVNLSLVTDGYATTLDIAPNEAHATELARAVSAARADGRGLWGACGGPDTPVG